MTNSLLGKTSVIARATVSQLTDQLRPKKKLRVSSDTGTILLEDSEAQRRKAETQKVLAIHEARLDQARTRLAAPNDEEASLHRAKFARLDDSQATIGDGQIGQESATSKRESQLHLSVAPKGENRG